MSNLTFEEKLIREHKAEPLEGHTVVVLERVGQSGERFHSLLEVGAERVAGGWLRALLGRPKRYFAFAVDASLARSLAFSEHVELAERAHGFDLHFTLGYRALDARLLVVARGSDPLKQVRSRVAEVVTEEMSQLSWAEGWRSPQRACEIVVSGMLPELKAFARDYGISITSLRVWVQLHASATEVEREIYDRRERGRRSDTLETVIRELKNRKSDLRRGEAERDEVDRADEARRRLEDAIAGVTTKMAEMIEPADSIDQLVDLHAALDRTLSGSTPIFPGSINANKLYRVWYATNRRPHPRGFVVSYGARLDDRVHYGTCDVVIPASHRMGELGSPWLRRILLGTDDRLRVKVMTPLEPESFWSSVRECAASFAEDDRQALVFIHGYRVSLQDAALRTAQLGYDLGVKGPVAFFSWPSRATLLGYPADGSAVEASEGAITDFLMHFARDCGAERVHVIAHSMGNRPLLRALQRIMSIVARKPEVPFGHLILAAPDITRELFLDVADQYRKLSHRTTLYVSDEDRALRASFRLQGPRVGLAPPVTCFEGIDTIHVANVDRTLLGHSTFAEARPVLYDIHALLNFDAPPERRAGLIERRQGEDLYWEVRA